MLLAAFDVLVPEQVIEVPKMSTPTRCPRTVLSVPQTAKQLVEAPTIVSLTDVIRHPVEQTVGDVFLVSPGTELFPFCGADRRQSSSSFSSWFWWKVFTVYTQDRVLQRLVKQIIVFQQRLPSKTLTFQFCVARLTIFTKIFFLQLVLPICRIRQIKGVFALFSVGKKCEDPAHPRVGTGRGLQLTASVGSAGGVTLNLAVTVSGVWVLLLSTENEILREMTISVGAILGSKVDTCSATVCWWLWTYFTHFLRCGRLES